MTKARKVAIDDAQKGTLGKLLGLEDGSDVVRTVGSVFTAQDAAKRMFTLRRVVGDDKEAQQGLRKVVVDHVMAKFVGNTEAATSGLGTIKADGFQTFVRQNQVALRTAGFSADELQLMGRIAEEFQRANRSIAAVKLPGGSNTVQDALQVGKGGNARSILAKSLIGIGAGGGAMVGGGFTAALGAVGAKAIGDMRMAGIEKVDDLLADALLNPGRARVLLSTPTTKRSEEATWQMLGALYRRSVAVRCRKHLPLRTDLSLGVH